MIKNNRGSILIVTLSFVLVFTLLGFGSIHYAYVQNEIVEKEKASAEAFWLADGAIEMAFNKLENNPSDVISKSSPSVNLGQGVYDVFSSVDSCPPTCSTSVQLEDGSCPCESWVIQSYGLVDLGVASDGKDVQMRAIYVKAGVDIGDYNIDKAIETHGSVNNQDNEGEDGCERNENKPHIFGGCKKFSVFTWEKVFNMTTEEKEAFLSAPDHAYLNPDNNGIDVIEGLTYITMTGNNNTLNISTASQSPKLDENGDPIFDSNGEVLPQGSLLVIDTEQVTSTGGISISFIGDVAFRGIVWVIGEGKIAGGAGIYGAVFIDGGYTEDTFVGGNAGVYFSPSAIDEALGVLEDGGGGGGASGPLSFISWKEINTVVSDYE